ncbi:SURF1 family protein [Thauera phenolivorans]|uniref:SURF1 family protein n=1 Tax=Thauera phenolivorans TaxID=1792543 RepID=UPI00083AD082|nr:SURF1 family protein [Thauera phenolivorans]
MKMPPAASRGAGVCLLGALPLLAGLALLALTVSLGNWQLRRAEEKTALQARIEALAARPPVTLRADAADVPEWLPLRLEGRWLDEATILLDNRTHDGRAGYHVLTPLALADGSGAVLVNRGWIAAGTDRTRLPAAAAPAGGQVLEGRVRWPEVAPFTLAAEAVRGRLWQYLDLTAYRQSSGLALAPWIVQQTSSAADGLVRDWARPDAGIDRHRGYAFQWYALAGLAGFLSAWYVRRRLSRRDHEQRKPRLA